MKTRKPQIGDIYELKTARGLAYIQYSHDGMHLGNLVRVLPGIHAVRPDNLSELARQPELYFVFSVIAHAVRRGQLEFVAHQAVPESSKPLPVMRKAGGCARDGRVLNWFIGPCLELSTLKQMQQAFHVDRLTQEQRKLSLVEIWPVSVLALEIERGWLPEHAEDFEEQDRRLAREQRVLATTSSPYSSQTVDHYLYFPKKSNAVTAAQRLQARGWAVEMKLGADDKSWLVLAKQPAPIDEDIDDLREQLERLAEELNGEYDGWGAAITGNNHSIT